MKNVSNNFKNVISKGGPFYAYAKIVLRDGTELELDSTDDFYIDGNSYNESGGDGFPLGVALSKTIDIGIENSNERYSGYDFYYSRITLYTEADLEDGTKERILEGTFTVIAPVSSGDIIEITAADDMYKSDVPYTSKLTYPATTRAILQEACSQSGISLNSAAFENDDFTVQAAPQGLTCRQVIGYVAMIAGGNAVMNEYNQLIIKTYQFPVFDSKKILSGGRFNQELEDMVSGGNFTQIHTNTISGGDLGDGSNYIILSEFSTDPDISTDDVAITGISTTVQGEGQEEDQEYLYGTDDYAIVIENPLIEGKEETAISLIGDLLIGIIARPFSGEFFPDPTVQFMDPVYLVDRKDNIYQSFVTSLTFTYLGNNNISNGLQSPEMNKSTYYSTATEVYRKARQDLQKSKTEWEKAVENLGNRLDNASGLYPTEEKQPDGSTIYYLHDKPTLEESGVVIKITAQAIGISTDGGETYPTGLTVDGEAIIKILQTIGVNADWINTGAIRVTDDDGNVIFSVDMDTNQIIISGDYVQIGGKTAGAAINDALQESKDYSDGKLADFVDSLTPLEVLELISQGMEGIYSPDGVHYYINASAIKSGQIQGIEIISESGNDWMKMSQSLLTGGYGSTTDGLLDLSANYSSGRHVVLESKTGDVILKSQNEFRVERQSGGMGYLVQSGGTDYFDDIGVSFGDTYPVIGIMYGEDDISGDPFLDIRLSNGRKEVFSASSGSSVDPGYGYMDSPIFSKTTTTTLTCNSTMEVGGNIFCAGTTILYKAPQFFNVSHVTSGGHLVFASDGATVAYLSSSSKRYKNHVSDMSDEEALKILDIPVIKFKYKDGYLFPTDFLVDKEIPGFYAEDVEEVNPILCQYNEDGSVEDWNYRTMIPYMVKTMQIQQKRIDNLQTQINELKTMILNMKGA